MPAKKNTQPSANSSSRIIAGGRKRSLSLAQKRFITVASIAALSISTYAGYTVVKDARIGAASCTTQTYQLSSQDKCISYIQEIINEADIDQTLKTDGVYDTTTQAAVTEFQQTGEFAATGIVDEATWQGLCASAEESVEQVYADAGCEALGEMSGNQGVVGTNTYTATSAPDAQLMSTSSWFSVVALPDTQSEVIRDVKDGAGPRNLVDKDMKWIIEHRNERKIQSVISSGDLTHAAGLGKNESVNSKIRKMWASISKSYKILDDAGIPYIITNGNHDTAAKSLRTKKNSYGVRDAEKNEANLYRDTSLMNATFPTTRVGLQGLIFKDADRVENSYRTFRVKNANWLIVAMEYAPRREVLDWAKSIVSKHMNYNVIVVTHQYMQSGGTKLYGTCDASDCVTAKQVHDELVMGYSNVKMLFSGHTNVDAILVEESSTGNKVVQYKTTMHACLGDQPCRNPIRIVKVDLAAGSVTSELCLNVTQDKAKDCKEKTTKGMQFVSSGS